VHDLLNRDISTFNVRDVPQTEGLQQQRHLSLETLDAWWFDCLERGYVFRSKIGLEEVFSVWGDHISTELLHASYMEFAKARNERHLKNRAHLGRHLTELGGKAQRQSDGITGEHFAEALDSAGRPIQRAQPVRGLRPPGYRFGTLDTARQAFVDKTKISVVWDNGAADPEPET